MFSDQLKTVKPAMGRNLLVIAGALVVACQLVAMGLVANEQVEKAHIRDSRLGPARVAMARCLEASAGSERHQCILQFRDASDAGNFAQADRPPQNLLDQVGDEREEPGQDLALRGLKASTPVALASRH